MKKKEVRDLLSQHVDALVQGEDPTSDILGDYSQKDDQVESLISLATSLKEVLVPVVNAAPYKRYWTSLAKYQTPEILIRKSRRIPAVWLLIAIIGSLLSLVSVIIVLMRYLKLSGKQQTSRSASTA